jgi:hypothetical protein
VGTEVPEILAGVERGGASRGVLGVLCLSEAALRGLSQVLAARARCRRRSSSGSARRAPTSRPCASCTRSGGTARNDGLHWPGAMVWDFQSTSQIPRRERARGVGTLIEQVLA